MRLDLVFDSFYLVSSLWGAGSPVCTAGPTAVSAPVHLVSTAAATPGATPLTPAAAAVMAFVDVNVIPMDSERVLAHHTVVVEGSRITAAGPNDKVTIPAGAVRIDGQGKYLMPGLGDMHSHFLHGSIKDDDASLLFGYLANGVTAIRNTNPFPGEAMQAFRKSEAAELSPHIYIAGNPRPFEAQGSIPDSAAAAYKAAGYEYFIWASDSLTPALRRLGLPRGIHLPHDSRFDEMLALGRGAAVEHLYRYLSALRLPSFGSRGDEAELRKPEDVSAAEIRKLAAATERAGIWVTPTLYCMTGSRAAEPRSVFLRQVVEVLQDEGVGLLLAGDDGGDVHDELATLVQAGLTPYQALRTGTYNVAQYLGLLNDRGTVAADRRADLVLLYGNPLEDIRHTREPAGVMANGRWFDRAELDRRLLASPKMWVKLMLNPRGLGFGIGRPGLLRSLTKEQSDVRKRIQALEAVADSLELAKPAAGQEEAKAHEALRRRFTAELGAISGLLSPEQHVVFDPIVHVWMREQARQGVQAVIPGVAPAP